MNDAPNLHGHYPGGTAQVGGLIVPTEFRHIEDYDYSLMHDYKRNQVEDAIFRTFAARGARIDELRFRLKRLLVTDRRFGSNAKSNKEEGRHYAFYSQKPPGVRN